MLHVCLRPTSLHGSTISQKWGTVRWVDQDFIMDFWKLRSVGGMLVWVTCILILGANLLNRISRKNLCLRMYRDLNFNSHIIQIFLGNPNLGSSHCMSLKKIYQGMQKEYWHRLCSCYRVQMRFLHLWCLIHKLLNTGVSSYVFSVIERIINQCNNRSRQTTDISRHRTEFFKSCF